MKITLDGKSIWINYHHLYCFYSIVHSGGMTAAAKTLGIGQSALSIQMRQFEAQLGFPLFDRSHRKVSVNERGKVVLSYAKEIFRLGSEMIHTLNDVPAHDRVHLEIGVQDTIPKHLTVQLVQKAMKQNARVTVVEGQPQDLLKSLIEHRIDLLVTNDSPQTEPGQIYVKKIARLPLWIVGGKSFTPLKKGFPQSLQGQPFVVPTVDSQVRQEFENFCVKQELKVDTVVETQDIMVQKLLAAKEIGLSIMPVFAVEEFLKKEELFLIGKLTSVFEEIFLISADRRIKNPAASSLMSHFELR